MKKVKERDEKHKISQSGINIEGKIFAYETKTNVKKIKKVKKKKGIIDRN